MIKSNKDNWQSIADLFILDWLKPKTKLLDIGCGRGELIEYAKKIGCSTTGIDIVQDHAETMLHDANDPLPFKNRSFDMVTSVTVLEHVKNTPALFKEVNRILKNDGEFIVTVPNTRWYGNKDKHSFHFDYKKIKKIIKESGFNIKKERHFVLIPRTQIGIICPIKYLCWHYVFRLVKA